MGDASRQRLRTYLAALPPRAQLLLLQEFEQVPAGDANAAVAAFVLAELRSLAGIPKLAPDDDDPMRLAFRPLEPFLVDSMIPRPGTIRRVVVQQIWAWLLRYGARLAGERLKAAIPGGAEQRDRAVADFQCAAALALASVAAEPEALKTALARMGDIVAPDDLIVISDLLRARDAFAALAARLPLRIREFGPSQITALEQNLAHPSLQAPSLLPFSVIVAMRRLAAPWQIIRLAIRTAGSHNQQRVTGTAYAIAVSIVLQELGRTAELLRDHLRAGEFAAVVPLLRTLHDGVRGLLGEIDIRADSVWGRQIAALRGDVSKSLRTHIEGLPARVHRLLRQRAAADIASDTRLEVVEAAETLALIEMVEACRGFADALALNEVTSRVHAELSQYVGATAEAVVAALRGCEPRVLRYRRQQADAAIALSRVLFGTEHAGRLQRSAELAFAAEAPQFRTA
jgi:hypothetical protein